MCKAHKWSSHGLSTYAPGFLKVSNSLILVTISRSGHYAFTEKETRNLHHQSQLLNPGHLVPEPVFSNTALNCHPGHIASVGLQSMGLQRVGHE